MIELKADRDGGAWFALKLQLKSILELFDPGSQIFYVDYPVHGNIGDLLINIGTEDFFLDYGVPIHRRYSVFDMPDLSRMKVSDNATFLCHGGGNFGDIYPKHQDFREGLLEAFPKARIVFLPQSLHYSSPQTRQRSLDKIGRHRNCHVLVRDRESFDALQACGVSHSSMMPDMAHQLWRKWACTAETTHGATMNFFRRDKEAVSVPAELREDGAGRSVDWSDVVSIPHKAVGGGVYYLLKAGGRALPPQLNTSLWYSARDKMIQDAVTYFLGYERVRTNRLHAMLLALLLGRKVNAFDNSYGKLTRYIDAWLAPCVQHEMAGR